MGLKPAFPRYCNGLKDRLGFNRTGVSSDMCLNGKFFTEFIALLFLSYIKKQIELFRAMGIECETSLQ